MTIQQRIPTGKYRLHVADYLRLGEAGSFGDARTELIEGEIWIMSPAHSRHALAQSRLDFALRTALLAAGSALEVYAAPSVKVSEETMPEPDLAVAVRRDEGPLTVADVRLLVEIADSSLERDLGEKAQIYAGASVPEYWVLDVEARVIHQHWRPAGELYAERRVVTLGEPLVAATMPELVVSTERL